MIQQEQFDDLYRVSRGQIEHIDNILSQRTVWLVISQSFFFGGYAVLTTGNPNNPMLQAKQTMLLDLFPIASIVLILLSCFDIISGMVYLKNLRVNYNKSAFESGLHNIYPPIGGFKMLNALKNLSPIAVPIVFLAIWIYIMR